MKALLRVSVLAILIVGMYAGISSFATKKTSVVAAGPFGMPAPHCPGPTTPAPRAQ
jgi:hypothetical protein